MLPLFTGPGINFINRSCCHTESFHLIAGAAHLSAGTRHVHSYAAQDTADAPARNVSHSARAPTVGLEQHRALRSSCAQVRPLHPSLFQCRYGLRLLCFSESIDVDLPRIRVGLCLVTREQVGARVRGRKGWSCEGASGRVCSTLSVSEARDATNSRGVNEIIRTIQSLQYDHAWQPFDKQYTNSPVLPTGCTRTLNHTPRSKCNSARSTTPVQIPRDSSGQSNLTTADGRSSMPVAATR